MKFGETTHCHICTTNKTMRSYPAASVEQHIQEFEKTTVVTRGALLNSSAERRLAAAYPSAAPYPLVESVWSLQDEDRSQCDVGRPADIEGVT